MTQNGIEIRTTKAAKGEIAHKDRRQECEPSLLEIKGLLTDIQTFITNITQENEALRKEVSNIQTLLEFNDKELRNVQSSHVVSAYAALQKKLD